MIAWNPAESACFSAPWIGGRQDAVLVAQDFEALLLRIAEG